MKPVPDPNVKENLHDAEIAAQRVVQRFHETLDFTGIFSDEFVTEPKLCARMVSFGDAGMLQRFDMATNERLFVAATTSMNLAPAYRVGQDVNEVPPEIKNVNQPKLVESNPVMPRDLTELNQTLAELENISAIYRRYLPTTIFSSPVYLENTRREREDEKKHHRVPRVEWGNKNLGIPADVPVYVVRPEFSDYYFIREKGKMKMFAINLSPDFRWF